MRMCNDGHDEVCYEVKLCPVCDLREKRDNEIEILENQIKELEDKEWMK